MVVCQEEVVVAKDDWLSNYADKYFCCQGRLALELRRQVFRKRAILAGDYGPAQPGGAGRPRQVPRQHSQR
jgi:hypothetical protein